MQAVERTSSDFKVPEMLEIANSGRLAASIDWDAVELLLLLIKYIHTYIHSRIKKR